MDIIDFFSERVEYREETGCWLWNGAINDGGYAYIVKDGKTISAHRWAYCYFYEEQIEKDNQIDHLCRTRNCVNPWHLESVTQRENLIRGETIPSINSKKTHCPQGHEYSPENTYISKRGQRNCKECNKINSRERYRRKAGLQ